MHIKKQFAICVLVVFLIESLIIYAATSFILSDFNLFNWDVPAKLVFVLLIAFVFRSAIDAADDILKK